MIWILLFICFCNITTGQGDQKSLLLVKDKNKSGNKIARRILEEITFRNVSKQKIDILNKKRDHVTSALKEHENGNNINITTTKDPLPIFENKHENDRVQHFIDKKPPEQARTVIQAAVSVIPVSPINMENFESSTVSQETEKNFNNRDDTKPEDDLINVADNLKKSIRSDKPTTNSPIEHVPKTGNVKNGTVNPLQINHVNTKINTTKQILRLSKNNTETQKLSYLIAKLSQFKEVQSKPVFLGHKNLTKDLAHNKNYPYLDSNKTNYSLESNAATFSAVKTKSQKPISFNFCNNTVMLTYIKKLNINLQKTSSFDDQSKLGSLITGNKKHNPKNSHKQEWKNLLTEKSPQSNTRYVVTEHSSYEKYVPQSKNNYFRQSKKSEGKKNEVTPISLDYYFGRNSNEGFDSYKVVDSDEVVDASEDESASVVKNDYDSVNFDKDTNTLGRSRNKVTLSVLRDMINMDSKNLVEYPWFKSILEVRSGILKIIDLINLYVYKHKIHPLDLELLKYLLYLHKSSSMKLQISETSPYSTPQLRMNPMQVPILTNLFKNIKKDGSKRGELKSDRRDPQLTIMFDLQDLMNEILLLLESFHRKTQDLAKNNLNPTQLYRKLKDEYLEHAEDQHLRVILLHISLARLFEYIDSSVDRVREGFFNYVQQHPEEVERDLELSMTILKVLHELRWK